MKWSSFTAWVDAHDWELLVIVLVLGVLLAFALEWWRNL